MARNNHILGADEEKYQCQEAVGWQSYTNSQMEKKSSSLVAHVAFN